MNKTVDIDSLNRALRSDPFTAADRTFVQFLEYTYQEENAFALAAAALCLSATREGHSYLNLSKSESLPPPIQEAMGSDWPSVKDWQAIAKTSPTIGTESDQTPLVLVGQTALYLRKYYEYEKCLANSLAAKAMPSSAAKNREPGVAGSKVGLDIPQQDQNLELNLEGGKSEDLQQTAINQALENRLYLISGGPGTGKTTTVLGYLNRALDQHNGERPLRIAAVAPTGKAAARLSESIRSGIERLDPGSSLKEQLLDIPCLTVHRLLQGLPHRTTFRRNRKNPLEYDIVVVDETSMIDLPLMQKLMESVPFATSVVLLGDHYQLSSVEVGSVFGDLTQSARDPQSPLFEKSTTLTKTYRFSKESSIYQFCESCKEGDTAKVEALLACKQDDFSFRPIANKSRAAFSPIIDLISEAHQSRLMSPDLESAFRSLGKFITLTPFNRGELGARALNQLADARIRRIHSLELVDHYKGMPLIVLENNYDLELFNGDMGIVWPESDSGHLFAWFNNPEKGLKRVRLNWLPNHDLAYCLTIHKSQGSEFDQVVGVFPPEENEFVSRELIYTCASRAKSNFTLFAEAESLKAGVRRSVKRATRLEEQIRVQSK